VAIPEKRASDARVFGKVGGFAISSILKERVSISEPPTPNPGKELSMFSLIFNKFCKAAILFLAALTCATLAAQSDPAGGKDKKRIGVAAFENDTQYKELSARMADMLVSGLAQNSINYELIERTRLNKLMEEHGLGMTGVINQSEVAQVGKIGGLDYIVLGTILEARANEASSRKGAITGAIGGAVIGGALGGKVGTAVADNIAGASSGASYSTNFSISITVKVVEVKTGRVLFVQDASAEDVQSWGNQQHVVSVEDFSKIARKAVIEVAKKITSTLNSNLLQPAVVRVRAREIIINKGRRDGISEGQTFAVYQGGEKIYDLDGSVLSEAKEILAIIDIKAVEEAIAHGTVTMAKKVAPNMYYEVKRGDLLSLVSTDNIKKRGEASEPKSSAPAFQWGSGK
jgi:curli biogenesis system outer membrane secretion channel CsgG